MPALVIRAAIRGTVRVVIAVVTALSLSACQHVTQGNASSDYPYAEQFPQLYQSKLGAAAHWKLIAENEARQITARFEEGVAFNVPTYEPHPGERQTDFAEAYRNFLISGLLKNTAVIYEDGQGYQMNYDVQIVRHKPRSARDLPTGFFSGTLGVGYLIGHAVENWSKPGLVLIPLALAADVFANQNADTETPNTEIILTTHVKNGGRIVYSNSTVYYFQARDIGLYDPDQLLFSVRGTF